MLNCYKTKIISALPCKEEKKHTLVLQLEFIHRNTNLVQERWIMYNMCNNVDPERLIFSA